MIYMVNFDKSQLENPKIFHAVITNIPGTSDWWHYLPSLYLLEGNTLTVNKIYNFIHASYPDLHLFVSIFNPEGYFGYLDKDAWDWISNKENPLAVVRKLLSNQDTLIKFKKNQSIKSILSNLK